MYSTITLNYDSLAAWYHIVFISKPGVPLVDSVFVPSLDSPIDYTTPSEYTKKLSAEWRAQAASLVLDFLTAKLPIDKKKIVVMGYSEGAQVAPHVAVLNKKVTHVICLVGNGLNQFYDFIIQERLRAVRGEVTEDQAQQNIDTLLGYFRDIYAEPSSTDKQWAGHSYQRWASFCMIDPLDYLLQLNIPVYLVKGTADENTQILSTDYVALEFLRRGKHNLTYKTYTGCNHFFQRMNNDGKPEDKMDEVIGEAMGWLSR
jgi:pimeloyl-ACP methyl ester carboxylesterase